MKNFVLILLISLFLSSGLQSKTQDQVPPKVKEKLQNSLLNANALGKYFVIAIPPNDRFNNGLQLLGIFIAASEQANVRVSTPEGLIGQYQIPKMQVVTVSTENSLNWSLMHDENDEEQVTNKGIIIESDKPISVYVIVSKQVTSEGYLAIPVNAWGYEYIHCSYYDFNEARMWRTGFIVLASEDKTRITINLKGRGDGLTTLRGKSLGATITKTLHKGQTFIMQGTGETRGAFDMTGTLIRGDKPIGIISHHERAMIPPFTVTNGRDNLIAMPPPVNTWGKNYVTVELDRSTDKGDFFRVVAGEDNTYFDVRWFDKRTGIPLGRWDGILDKKGDFMEYHPASAQAPHDIESIRGVSYFKSDKPIFVMQYCYSAYWDRTPKGNYDPFMFPVSLVEQFTDATIFQTPSNTSGDNEYLDNYLNLVVYADAETEEERHELLRTLKMDNKPVVASEPELLAQKFPAFGSPYDNKLYWVTLEPQIGPHTLEGDVSFGGYIYGFASFDSYGWPAATAYRDLGILDTLPPVLEIIEDCGYFEIRATEFRDQDPPEDCDTCRPQVDQGMSQLPTIVEKENFTEARINYEKEEDKNPNQEWYGTPIDYDLNFIYEVIDKKKDGFINFVIADNTFENFADTTIYYYADKLRIDEVVDFGLNRLYHPKELTIKLKSDKEFETVIKEMKFQNTYGQFYEVVEPQGEIIIPPKGEKDITLRYTPTREYLDAELHEDGRYDLDSLLITTECVEFAFPVKGQGGEQYMYVSDWANQTVPINTLVLSNGNQLYIQNYNHELNRQATFPLEVYGLDIDNITDENDVVTNLLPFGIQNDLQVDANNEFATTYILPHENKNQRVPINRASFQSADIGVFTRNVPFTSDAVNPLIPSGDEGDDTLSTWQMTTLFSDASATNEIWEKERLNRTADNNVKATINNGIVYIRNNSEDTDPDNAENNSIKIRDIYFEAGSMGTDKLTSNDGAFRITLDPNAAGNTWLQEIVNNQKTNLKKIYPKETRTPNELALPVEFTPKGDYATENHLISEVIYVEVEYNSGEFDTLECNLIGEVYLPIIETVEDISTDAVLLGNLAPYQLQVPVRNIGYNYPLTIWNISDPDNADFTLDRAVDETGTNINLPTEAIPWEIDPGLEYTLYYNFIPSQVGDRRGNIEFTHSGNIEGVEPVEDGVNTRQEHTEFIQAPGRSTGFDVTDASMAAIKCDDDSDVVTFTNNGSDPLTITSIKVSDGRDLNNVVEFAFDYENTGDVNNIVGDVIPAGGTKSIDVTFVPSALPFGNLNSDIIVVVEGEYDNGDVVSGESNISGVATENLIKLTMKDNTNPQNLTPNLELRDGDFNLGVSVNLENATPNWAEANIEEVTFSIKYKVNWLQPIYSGGNDITNIQLKAGAAAPNWNFTVTDRRLENPANPDDGWEIMTIRGTGTAIQNNGVLVYPYFSVKLPGLNSDSTKIESIEPEIIDISFGTRDACIFNEGDTGYVDVEACALAVRTLPITLGNFSNDPTVTSTSLKFNYAVPYESSTRIEVIDMNGNLVEVPVSETKIRGYYEAEVPLSRLSSGAHIIRYTAGHLIKTDKVMIVK